VSFLRAALRADTGGMPGVDDLPETRDDEAIRTSRLSLVLLRTETLAALLSHDLGRASSAQGLDLPADLISFDGADDPFLQFQLGRHRSHPDQRAWCARVMVGEDGEVIGRAGFHGPPGAVGRPEIGYAVRPRFRRQGYATEAAEALVSWAWKQGEDVVFASVSPHNAASLAVVRKLGFVCTGVQMDEIDGEELVFQISRSGHGL
jgi:[ribosomal protein S5]-alanine N-acetyltransferase